ncbi:MAG: hypothetical protein RI925_1854 [Pseudomonadota bacterium]|jgi:MFS family permease
MAWLVYRITGSAALLGVTAFAALIPQLLIGPLAGAWVDKHDKRRALLWVQALLTTQALLLAWLTWMDWVSAWLLVAMSALMGVLNSFDTPLRQSLISAFVGRREDLPNALALNAMLFNSGRFIGPPIAGLLLANLSEAACFAVNALSFLALIAAVSSIRLHALPRAQGSMGDVFREGVVYAWHTWLVRMLILTLIALNLTASAYAVLLPVFARDVFAGDARTLGWLWGAAGCGAFLSTLYLATRQSMPGLVRSIVWGAAMSALALAVFGLTRQLPVALAAMVVLGFGISVSNVGINMVLQSTAPDRLRGRVVSFFTSARFGFDALGGLIAGVLATALGAGVTLALEGGVLLGFVLFLLSRRRALRQAIDRHDPAAH